MLGPHLQLLLAGVAGWVNRNQQDVIGYLQAENAVLREQLGGGRIRFTDRQRRRLAAAAKRVGRGKLFGIEPAPERGRKVSWARFLRSDWGAIAATDFFTVEVLTMRGLVRYLVCFVIDLKTRKVEIAGIVHRPNGAWMEQTARNLTDVGQGFLRDTKYLIHDRDPLFTEHYHRERNHQGLENRLIDHARDGPGGKGAVACQQRLGGVLNYYYREAA